MTPRGWAALAVAVLLAGAAGLLAPWAGSAAGPAPAVGGPVPPAGPAADAASPATLARRVFSYEESRPSSPPFRPPPVVATPPPPEAPEEPPAPAVRVIGLVRRGGTLKAALAVGGETFVLGPGGSAAGYTVLGVDADRGVTVRTPEGREVRLAVEGE